MGNTESSASPTPWYIHFSSILGINPSFHSLFLCIYLSMYINCCNICSIEMNNLKLLTAFGWFFDIMLDYYYLLCDSMYEEKGELENPELIFLKF